MRITQLTRGAIFTLSICLLLSCNEATKTSPDGVKIRFSSGTGVAAFVDHARNAKITAASETIRKIFTQSGHEMHFPATAYGIVIDNQLILAGASGFINLEKKIAATPKSLFRIASMTKSFTAMAIVKLRDEGKIELDKPAAAYVHELAGISYLTEDSPQITVRNLLTMTAGFPEDNPWGDRQLAVPPDQLLQFIRDGISFSNPPSKEFEYSNLGYALLGQIISNVSGMPYQQYISRELLEPLGMSNTKWEYSEVDEALLAHGYRWEDNQWKEEPLLHDGSYGAMGGLITSIEDFSKYVMFHLSAWPARNGEDTGPVSRSSLREMHKPWQFRTLDVAGTYLGKPCASTGGYGYGLGWRRNCEGIERLSHSGGLPGFGSEYRFYPEHGFGIICFANLTYANAGELNGTVMDTLFQMNALSKRLLPVSDSLQVRSGQLVELLKSWDPVLERKILAENFYLDKARGSWQKNAAEFLKAIGTVLKVEQVVPENQLRGKFRIDGELRDAEIFFTLTPEHSPKVQQLDLHLLPEEPKIQ